MSSKITRALPELVENGIITAETAQKITAYYEKPASENSNKLFIIFGILGATLVGLGIILIMAHNWDDLPKFVKLILAFLPMLIGQAGLAYSIVKNKGMVWKETATVFLFFSVGACIALVSQIYHISGNLESFLLAWIILCAPLLYLTKSKAAIFLHLIFCTYYAIVTGYGFNVKTSPLFYFALLSTCIPRYLELMKQKTPSAATFILHWLFPISLLISLPVCVEQSPQITYILYMTVFGLLFNIGQLSYFKNTSLLQNGYKVTGTIGTLILLLILSFHGVWDFAFQNNFIGMIEVISVGVFFIAAGITFLMSRQQQNTKMPNVLQLIFFVFGIIFLIGASDTITATVLVNILLFVIGIMQIKLGTDKLHFGFLNLGMLIIAALIVCRFYDTDINFAIRGIIFVSIGIGFFITNYIMYKKQQIKK
ncbi:hypothetical protein KORDIASMS9_01995 [Kordia sp. SMS9]|uniref:DUF2157 domain-containing protein n=1 Tax=Kordia sp. SMS9 TaxID=2282170 RepID=UPI000E0CC69B|nr:DUF2157 domain-containing protein [Kordia sp. SMS9]AXG69768.1 hypothetical protein KORDIASMS9_01995 [Kordia sp. SMS9]